jgi:arabinose-5-phosphate isomerase
MAEVISEISSKRLGATTVVDENSIKGIITDGDLRRLLQKGGDLTGVTAADIMSANPKTVEGDMMAVDALNMMKRNNITQLVVASGNEYLGMIHLHDLLNEGII